MELINKKVLVTGGTSGIGREMVLELANLGVKDIAIIARDKHKMDLLVQEYPNLNFVMIQGNVSDIETIKHTVATLEKEWGNIDILINNAGIVSAGLLEEVSDDDILNQLSVNIAGVILLTKYALPLIKKSKEGNIMNVSSVFGILGMPFYSVYASTKAAIRQFTDVMRRELAPFNIHVMCIYPGATETNMMKSSAFENMDSPTMVAKRSIEGLLNKELHVILGDQPRLDDIKLNFESPEIYDEKIKGSYETLRRYSSGHKSL